MFIKSQLQKVLLAEDIDHNDNLNSFTGSRFLIMISSLITNSNECEGKEYFYTLYQLKVGFAAVFWALHLCIFSL